MPFHVACPTCGNVMAVPEGSSGQQVACPTCQHAMTVPPMPPPAMARAKPVTPPQSTRKLRDEAPPRRSRRDDWDDKPEPRRRRLKLYQPSKQAYIVGAVAVVVQMAIGAAFMILDVGVKYMNAMEARPEINARDRSGRTVGIGRAFDPSSSSVPLPSDWVTKDIQHEGLRVSFPGEPKHVEPYGDVNGRVETWTCPATQTTPSSGAFEYELTVMRSPSAPRMSDDQAMKLYLIPWHIRAGQNYKDESSDIIRVNTYRGRETTIRSPTRAIFIRIIPDGARAIAAVAYANPTTRQDDPTVRAFLDNVRFTK